MAVERGPQHGGGATGGTDTAGTGNNPYGGGVKDTTPGGSVTALPGSSSGYDVDRFNSTDQAAAQANILRAATQGMDSFDAVNHHFGYDPLDNTQMYLRAVGAKVSTGGELEAAVARTNKIFEDAYGHGPTPGLVLDMIRTHTVNSKIGMQRLLAGQKAIGALQAGTLGESDLSTQLAASGRTAVLDADQTKAAQLRSALSLATVSSFVPDKKGETHDNVTPVTNLYAGQGGVDQTIDALHGGAGSSQTLPTAVMLTSIMPINTTDAMNTVSGTNALAGMGIPYDSLSGNLGANKRTVINAFKNANVKESAAGAVNLYNPTAVTNILGSMDAVAAVQKHLIKEYGIKDASATGILNGNWPSILKNLQTNESYRMTTQLMAVQSAGYGDGAFDPFNAVDTKTGKFLNNDDGRRAKVEFGKWKGAVAGKAETLKNMPFGRDIYAAMPLGAFDASGISFGSVGKFLAGGNDHDYNQLNPAWLLTGGIFGVGGNFERAFARIGSFTFAGMTGVYNQAKRDAFALEALVPHVGRLHTGVTPVDDFVNAQLQPLARSAPSWSERKAAAGRRLTQGETPTWLDMYYNSPHGQAALAGDLKGMGVPDYLADKGSTVTDVASNAIIDFYITKDLGPGKLNDLIGGKAITGALGDSLKSAVWVDRSPDAVAAIAKGFKNFTEGRISAGIERFGVFNDRVFFERNIVKDADGNYVMLDAKGPAAPGADHVPNGPEHGDPVVDYNPTAESDAAKAHFDEVYTKSKDEGLLDGLTDEESQAWVQGKIESDAAAGEMGNLPMRASTSVPPNVEPPPVHAEEFYLGPERARVLDAAGQLDTKVDEYLSGVNTRATTRYTDDGALIRTHDTPVGNYSKVHLVADHQNAPLLEAHVEKMFQEAAAYVKLKLGANAPRDIRRITDEAKSVEDPQLDWELDGKVPDAETYARVYHPPITNIHEYLTAMHEIGHLRQIPHMGRDWLAEALSTTRTDAERLRRYPEQHSGQFEHLNQHFNDERLQTMSPDEWQAHVMNEATIAHEADAWNFVHKNSVVKLDKADARFSRRMFGSYTDAEYVPATRVVEQNERTLQDLTTAAEGRGMRGVPPRGSVTIRVNPSSRAYITHIEVPANAQDANVAAAKAIGEARERGATVLAAKPGGMSEAEVSLYKRMVTEARNAPPEARLFVTDGEPEFVKNSVTGLWDHVGGGQIRIKPVVDDPVLASQQEVAAQAEDSPLLDLHDEAVQAALLGADDPGREVMNIHEAIRDGMPIEQFHDWTAAQVANGRLFHNIQAGLPSTSGRLFDPGLSWTHPTPVIPHPIRFLRNGGNGGLHWTMNNLERAFKDSRVPGQNLVGNMVREVHVLFSRAANGGELPITEYDPQNIVRAARTLGLSQEHGETLAGLFSKARYDNDGAMLQKIENTLREAGYAQGRKQQEISQIANVFSGRVDRSGEHLLYKHDALFGKDGVLETRQWAGISAAQAEHTPEEAAAAHAELKQKVRAMGLEPLEVVGKNGEKSLLVPGMTPTEATQLAKEHGQEGFLTPKGMIFSDGPLEGKLIPRRGPIARSGDTTVKIGSRSVPMDVPLGPIEARIPVADPHALSSLPFGEVKPMTAKDQIARELAKEEDPERRAELEQALSEANADPAPVFTSEMYHNFSIPVLRAERQKGFLGMLNNLNRQLLLVGRINRRALLTLDPILFWKHAVADTARRVIGEYGMPGGIGQMVDKDAKRALAEYHAANPEAKTIADEMAVKNKDSELNYNVTAKADGPSTMEGFWTNGADKQHLDQAAAYIHRRVMDGAYQAHEAGGVDAVVKFFREDPKGMQLAREENLSPDLLGRMVGENLDTIGLADPTFLSEAARIVEQSKPGKARESLVNWMKETDRNVPVTGHVSSSDISNLTLVNRLDSASQKIIATYMTMNKVNKGGMFHDVLASAFKMQREAGIEDAIAHDNAVGIANRVVKYHLLDLADALKVEQTFRWADYFLTKHRLYWKWIMSTMVNRPEVAISVMNFQKLLEQTNGEAGQITFDLPGPVTSVLKDVGVVPAGGSMSYTVPLARLFWLDSSSSVQPGAASVMFSDIASGDFDHALPFGKNSNIDATTMDGTIKYAIMLGSQKLPGSHNQNSTEVLSHLNPADAYKFKQTYWRVYAGGVAHGAWKGLTEAEIDERVTHAAMKSQLITTMWRNSGFTGGYVNDPKLSSAQDKIWNKYNNTIDPARKAQMREEFPWINGQIGIYNTTAQQHVKSNKLWATYQTMLTQHEQNQNALLAKFKATGDAKYLFGADWHAESNRFSDQYKQFQADSAKLGATDYTTQMANDRMMTAYAQYAGQLHHLFPLYTDKQVEKLVKEAAKPKWVDTFQNALDTTYSPASIKALPVDLRQTAYSIASYYKTRLMDYESDPAKENEAEQLRGQYFDKVYGKYQDHVDAAYTNIDKSLDAGEQYDQLRSWQDKADHEYTIKGVKFPSPARMSWIMLPPEAREGKRQAWALKNWSWLTSFQKETLGVKVHPDVQHGWDAYNKAYYGAKAAYAKQNGGKSLYIDDAAKLDLAQQANAKYPGFLEDYVRSVTPAWQRLLEHPALYGGTPKTQKVWHGFIEQIATTANGWAGQKLPRNSAAGLMAYNANFRMEFWTQLITKGSAGTDHGIPIGTGPTKQYPTGGYYYRWAKAQHSPEFFQQFQAQMHANPDFIALLFTPGG